MTATLTSTKPFPVSKDSWVGATLLFLEGPEAEAILHDYFNNEIGTLSSTYALLRHAFLSSWFATVHGTFAMQAEEVDEAIKNTIVDFMVNY